MKIKKILVAIDDESNEHLAIEKGIYMASAHKAEVNIVAVFKQGESLFDSLKNMVSKKEFDQKFIRYHKSRIEKTIETLNVDNANVSLEILIGVPFVEIIRKAFHIDADLIIQSSHSHVESAPYFSSADWHLMRKSPIPTWVIKEGSPKIPKQLVVALDINNFEDNLTLNQNLLSLASTLAIHAQAHLRVLSVWRLEGEGMLRDSPFMKISEEKLQQLLGDREFAVKQEQKRLKDWLEQDENWSTLNCSWHLQHGNPREQIPKFTRDNQTNLLILGTVNRTGIPGVLIGNTAETILTQIECSVLTMKPPLFQSPVMA